MEYETLTYFHLNQFEVIPSHAHVKKNAVFQFPKYLTLRYRLYFSLFSMPVPSVSVFFFSFIILAPRYF